MATDYLGESFLFNGRRWMHAVPVHSNLYISEVACATTTFCVVLGQSNNANYPSHGVIYRFNGQKWSFEANVPVSDGVAQQVSCPTTRFCLASTSSGSLLAYNGLSWGPMEPSITTRSPGWAVSCATSTFCGVADAYGHVAVYQSGRWSKPVSFGSWIIGSPSCPSVGFCVATALRDGLSGGATFYFSRHRWSGPEPTSAFGYAIDALSCPSDTTCMGGDVFGDTYLGKAST